jgi:NAD(P)-dependent dehydrogenase (short-subunit alcohol dehydrogenase family)
MDLGLDGKVVFITGAGGGIGRAFAHAFAKEGTSVAVAEIDAQRAEGTATEIVQQGGRALAVPCDVGDEAQVEGAVQRTLQEFGQIDILINDAVSPLLAGSLLDIEDMHWDDNFRVNVKGSFYCIKAVVPGMKQRRYGKIISMASVVGRRGSSAPTSAAYAGSKGAIIALTASAARELGPHNINVNAIAPVQIDTPRWRDARNQEQIERTAQGAPLGRLGRPEDLTGLALLLASDASSYISGQTITVDGGTLCM